MSDLIPDFIDLIPDPVLPNSVPYFDGCHWTMVVLPAGGMTCAEVITCMSPEVSNIWADLNTKLECSDLVNCQTIIDIINDIADTPTTTLALVETIVASVNSGTQFSVPNWGSIRFQWHMWLTTDTTNDQINIYLPGGWLDGQVLTRDADNWYAYWDEPMEVCCDWVHDCMQPIIDMLQNQINNIIAGWPAGTDDFVDTMSWDAGTRTITLERVLWGVMNLVLSDVSTNDDYVVTGLYDHPTRILRLTRNLGGFVDIDLSTLVSEDNFVDTFGFNPITNIVTIWRTGTLPDLTIDLSSLAEDNYVDGFGFNSITNILTIERTWTLSDLTVDLSSLAGVGTDELVAVSWTDTTSTYLRTAIINPDSNIDSANNITNIRLAIINPAADETLQFELDMSTYVGNVEIQWDFHVTGTTTLGDLNFDVGTTVDWTNTTQTGTTTYDSSYVANYDGSTIVYNDTDIDYTGTTVINYADTVVTNHNGDTINNDNTTENNTNVTNNYDDTSVVNYDGSTINNNNTTNNYNSTFTALGCSGATAMPFDGGINPTATKVEATIVYDNTGAVAGDTWTKLVVITEFSWLVTVNDVANGHSGELTIERNTVSGNIEVRQISGAGTSTADVCQFSGGVIINDDGSITNNDNTVTNNDNTTTTNTGSDTYYDDNSTVTNMWDTYNENLTVNNLTMENGTLVADATWEIEEYVGVTTTVVLTYDPVDEDSIMTMFTDSGIETRDRTYNPATKTITFWADQGTVNMYVRYMRSTTAGALTWPKKVLAESRAVTGTTHVVTDTDITTDTVVLGWTVTSGTQVGFREFTMAAGSMTVTSSASETAGLVFNYVIL